MDETKYEKIECGNVLIRLRDGYQIFDRKGLEYKLGDHGMLLERESTMEEYYLSGLPFNDLLTMDLYTYKPFNVRKAMLDRPNEWVGKFKSGSEWWSVGFDANHFNVIAKRSDRYLPVDTTLAGMTFPRPEDLDDCIPIGTVTEEAKR